jgi:hypothetical protein
MAARLRITKWNADKILARSAKILQEFGPIIAEEAKRQITTEKWNWPGPTRRKSGQFVPAGLRDIVDTGALLGSQTAPQVNSDGALSVLSIRWTEAYAADVAFQPFTTSTGAVARPRNWIAASLDAQPFRPFFFKRWRELQGQ